MEEPQQQPPQQRNNFAMGVGPTPRTRPRTRQNQRRLQFKPADAFPEKKEVKPLLFVCEAAPMFVKYALMFNGCRVSDIHLYRAAEEKTLSCLCPEMKTPEFLHEKKITDDWLLKELQLRTSFKVLVALWRQRKYGSRKLNDEDPATLSIPKKPITVFDQTARGVFTFEAASIRRSIEADLAYSEWLFPNPKRPRNPLTNMVFTQGQMLHIALGLRKFGFGSWLIEAYLKLKMNLKALRDTHIVALKLQGLDEYARNPTDADAIDYLNEFIEDQYDYHHSSNRIHLRVIQWATQHRPNSPYIVSWRKLFHTYYKWKITYGEDYLENNDTLRWSFEASVRSAIHDHAAIADLARQRLDSIPRRAPTRPELIALRDRRLNAARRIQAVARGYIVRSNLRDIRRPPPTTVLNTIMTQVQPIIGQYIYNAHEVTAEAVANAVADAVAASAMQPALTALPALPAPPATSPLPTVIVRLRDPTVSFSEDSPETNILQTVIAMIEELQNHEPPQN